MKKLGIIVCLSALALTVTLLLTNAAELSPTDVNLGISAYTTPDTHDWTAAKAAYERWQENGTATPAEKEMITEYLQRGRTPSNGNRLDNTGGPDGYGYLYVDNQGGDTATFSWIELCGDGLATDGPVGDDADALATIGWNFPFYGTDYGTVNVCTNGFMRFDDIFDTYVNPCPLETQTDEPGPLIAPYWDDLYAIGSGGCTNNGVAPWIRYRNFGGNYFVVEWSQIPHYPGSADRYSFEVILYPDGKIKFQYNTNWNDAATPGEASIGIDEQAAGNGLAYSCSTVPGASQITGGRAIWFYLPQAPCADFTATAPGSWSGSTCGAGNDCTLRTSEELIYAVTIPQGGQRWSFTTCDSNTDFDSYIFLTTDCCGGTTLASNDDGCGLAGHSLNSTFVSDVLAAGTYYLAVEAWSGCGNYTLRIEPACISCQPGDVVEAAENPADTTYYLTDPNGGCNSSPNQFGNINFNETVCGVSFFYDGPGGNTYRDTDWYSFTVAQTETITVDYWSEFAKQVAIVNYGDCSNIQLMINVQTDVLCDYEYAFAYLPAGTYALFFGPTFAAGDFSISDSLNYRVTLSHGAVSADEPVASLPSVFALYGNYPNPFNPETRISFALPRAADVKLAVYDIMGRQVSVLAQQRYEAGTHNVQFNGADLPSGIYFTRMEAADFTASQKMVLLK